MQGVVLNNKLNWLYLDLNSYFASVEQQIRPELRGKPVIVVPLMSNTTSAIAASYEAKRLGIKTGTNVGDAKKMCKGLIVVEANHKHYVDYHHRMIEEIDKHIPIDKVASIDEFACELQGKQCTPEGAAELAAKIKAGMVKNVGEYIKCSIGVAPNKFLAKIASDMKKPDGFTVMMPDDIERKLLTLKPRDIPGVGWNMERRLLDLGITSMKDLLALDPKHMRKIWHSVMGERMWYWLRGHEIAYGSSGDKRTIGHSHVLDPKFRPQNKAYIVAQRLTLKAASRMRRLEYYAKGMSLSIRVQNGPRVFVHKGFYRACDNFTMQHVLAMLWQEATAQINRNDKIKKVSVTLFDLQPANSIQPELLDILPGSKSVQLQRYEKASAAMDSINSKYGKDSIVMGFTPSESTLFSGVKIAFDRIPDEEEFYE